MSRRPAKGSPLSLPEIFWWTLILVGYVLVVVIAVAYFAQDNDPEQVREVCVTSWDCEDSR